MWGRWPIGFGLFWIGIASLFNVFFIVVVDSAAAFSILFIDSSYGQRWVCIAFVKSVFACSRVWAAQQQQLTDVLLRTVLSLLIFYSEISSVGSRYFLIGRDRAVY